MKLIDCSAGTFLKVGGKLYLWDNNEKKFREVKIEDCNGGIVAQIGTIDDDPKNSGG